MITVQEIRKARERIDPHIHRTPLLRLHHLDAYLGCKVYAKLESFQKTNSFKVRGALNALMSLPEDVLSRGVVTASSGNHGKALAYAGAQLGVKVHVVIPETAPQIKVDGVRSYGAEVIFSSPAERMQVARGLAEERGWHFVSPFDDALIMAGQGTAALEIMEELPDLDAILVPIGGGGLIGGIATAIKGTRPEIRVIGAEPAVVPRYTKSLLAGERILLPPESRSVADGLQTLRPGEINFPVVKKHVDEIVTVEEEEILRGTKLFLTEGKLLGEISSCITLGAILQGAVRFQPEDQVVLFITGGNIGMDQFEKFKEMSV